MQNNSLQKKFLLVAIPIVLILSGIILYSQQLVNRTANQSIRSVAEIRQVERSINEIRSAIQTLEQLVYLYTVIYYSENTGSREQIKQQLVLVDKKVKEFLSNDVFHNEWQEADKQEPGSFAALSARLVKSNQLINRYTNYYSLIVSDFNLRFPATPYVVDKLLPLNNEFIAANNLALEELNAQPDSRTNSRIKYYLNELRYAWGQQISLFRLFAANRSGIFATPEVAMRGNLTDREIYVSQIDGLLKNLETLDKRGGLGFQTSVSIKDMRTIYTQYESSFAEVQKLFMSEKWRIDMDFLTSYLQPEFKKITDIIDQFSEKIKFRATSTITQTQNVASNISGMLWLLGLILFGLMSFGYLLFEHVVRKPVLVIADAMNAEASGRAYMPVLQSRSRETSLLIDAFHNMQEQVHSRQARLESILEHAAEGIVTTDEDGRIETFNAAAEKLFGYKQEEVIGRNVNMLMPAEMRQLHNAHLFRLRHENIPLFEGEREVVAQRKDGSQFPMAIKLSEMNVAGKKLYTAMMDDVSERMEMIKNLRNLAEHDSLTGLFNRHVFLQELERVAQRAARGHHTDVALLYIDLDNFKYVNDTMGHLAGDKLLIEVSRILKKRTRDSDLIARLGGDEFAVILYDVQPDNAAGVADSFRQHLQDYNFSHEGKIVDIGCSVGITMVEKGITKEEWLSRADYSCHTAKRMGRNKIHLYTAADQENINTISDDMGWARRIKNALEHDRFMFVIQPIMETQTRQIDRYEILLRMLDHTGKFIMPAGFLPPAERFGLMTNIDKWVVNHAFEFLQDEKCHVENVNLSVNLSAHSFSDQELIEFITDKLTVTGVNPAWVTFEITETVAMADLDLTASFLEKIRALGCSTALDDFGVGYSSFAYLKDLPVDYVKIDGSFVRDIETNEVNRAIVKSMNDVAQAMGKKTVAEFVESEKAVSLLELMGIDYLQGYFIGQPAIPDFEKRRITLGARSSVLTDKFSA